MSACALTGLIAYPLITSSCALTGLIAYSILLITFTATVFTNTPIVVIAYALIFLMYPFLFYSIALHSVVQYCY